MRPNELKGPATSQGTPLDSRGVTAGESRNPDWWQANWELYEMSVNRQPRLTTFRNMLRYGVTARDAAEAIQHCEREG